MTPFKLALALVALAILAPSPVEAQDQDITWALRRFCGAYAWDGSCAHWRYRRVRTHVYRPTRVYAYERRDRDDERWERRNIASERGEHCKDTIVRVVGGAHLTKDGAMNDAIRQWQATVRYDHGERFMEIENARGYRWRCDRASTNETTVGKIGEALSGGSGFQKRCVVVAKPCMMPVVRGDKDRDER